MTDTLESTRQALADRYTIDGEVGQGGMATVFHAHDLKHDRAVAVKVLRPDLAAILGVDRFLREIRITANLQHPHILQLYDSGDAGGVVYYVMPLVEGETLRDRLNREKRLPVDEVARLVGQIANAMDYAHRHGVIHRDLKPENVMLQDGEVLIADFGVALAITGGTGRRLTESGLSMGTPAYMSPEQAAGGETLDARSDVYALAAVAYEMLIGQPPFTGVTTQSVVSQHLASAVPNPCHHRPDLPGGIAEVVQKGLAKDPRDRFPSCGALAHALADPPDLPRPSSPGARYARVGLLLLVLGLAARWFMRTPEPVDVPTLAVLPFELLDGASGSDKLVAGMHVDVLSSLGRLRNLEVRPLSAVTEYRNTDKPTGVIGRELNVGMLVRAVVERQGAAYRITASLEDTRRDRVLWQAPFSARFDSPVEYFDVRGRVASTIARELEVVLVDDEGARLTQRLTEDPEALLAYLRGLDHLSRWQFHATQVDSAIAALSTATSRDTTFTAAWAKLSLALSLSRADAMVPRIRQAAARALALDPGSPDALVADGIASYATDDFQSAARRLEAVLQVDPDNGDALWILSASERRLGRWEAAAAHAERLVEVDPRNPAFLDHAGYIMVHVRRYGQARALLRRARDLAPGNLGYHWRLALLALQADGDIDRARQRWGEVGEVPVDSAIGSVTGSFDPWPLFRVLYVSPAYRSLLRSLGTSIGAGWSGRNRALALAWGNERLGDSSRAEELFDGVRVAARDFLATGTREHTNLRHSALVHLGMALVGVDSVDAGLAILDQASDSLRQAPDRFSSQEVRKVLAEAYVAAGAWDDALRELRYLLDRPSALSTTLLEVDPVWDPIRDDPRFADLLRAFGEPGP